MLALFGARHIFHVSDLRVKSVGDNSLVLTKRNKILSRTMKIADLVEWFLCQSTVSSINLFLDVTIIIISRMGVSLLFWNQPDW